ncbi:MAG TPA: hypothetical protein VNQ79_21855 [Blastocatellia bacterium]|nr:hypothetical protein [Blastocatellia bacterium]
MQEGGDQGKGPNKTGTQPKGRMRQKPDTPGNSNIKGGAGRGVAGSKHAAERAVGARTSETGKAGPKKIAARTTARSGDK